LESWLLPGGNNNKPQENERTDKNIFPGDGQKKSVQLPEDGTSAFPAIFGEVKKKPGYCTLAMFVFA